MSLFALIFLHAMHSMASYSYCYSDQSALLQLFTYLLDYFRDKIIQVFIFAFKSLYLDGGKDRIRGLKIIEVITEYGRCCPFYTVPTCWLILATLLPILHEIWAIYSLTRNILPDKIGLEETQFFVEQMAKYGVLKFLWCNLHTIILHPARDSDIIGLSSIEFYLIEYAFVDYAVTWQCCNNHTRQKQNRWTWIELLVIIACLHCWIAIRKGEYDICIILQ